MSRSSSRSERSSNRALTLCVACSVVLHLCVASMLGHFDLPAEGRVVTPPTAGVQRAEHPLRLSFVNPHESDAPEQHEGTAPPPAPVEHAPGATQDEIEVVARREPTLASDTESPTESRATVEVDERVSPPIETDAGHQQLAIIDTIEEAWRYSDLRAQLREWWRERLADQRERRARRPPEETPPEEQPSETGSVASAASAASERGASSPAKLEGTLSPRYPERSRRRGEEGLVLLRVRVLADGTLGAIEVVEHPGHARLVDAAIEAVREATFTPAHVDGEPNAAWLVTPVRFVLE